MVMLIRRKQNNGKISSHFLESKGEITARYELPGQIWITENW